MIIDCIADLHGYYPELEGGDLLIVAGDLTARDTKDEYNKFSEWLQDQPYNKRIFISGNHDNCMKKLGPQKYKCPVRTNLELFEYLFDSGTEFDGLKIWGSPWTLTFPEINPHCTAFTGTEEELEAKFAMIPDDIDILISHGPAYGLLDKTSFGLNAGSFSLGTKAGSLKHLKLWVFGHIHEGYGKFEARSGCQLVNCSHVNEHYQPVNKPIRVIL